MQRRLCRSRSFSVKNNHRIDPVLEPALRHVQLRNPVPRILVWPEVMAIDPNTAGLQSRGPQRQWLMQHRISRQREIGAKEERRFRRDRPVRRAHPASNAFAI